MKPSIWKLNKSKIYRNDFLTYYKNDCKIDNIIFNKGIKVISWNIHLGSSINGIKNIDLVINELKLRKIHFALLQEVNSDDINKLEQNFKNVYVGNVSGKINNVIISVFKLDNFIIKNLHFYKENRIFIYGTWKNIFIGCTHLDVYDLTENTRIKQIQQITNIIQYYKDYKIILGGDFNSLRKHDYTFEEQKWLMNHLDSKNTKIESFPSKTISIIESILKPTFPILKYTVWTARRVDYLFYLNLNVYNKYVIYNNISDHFALYASYYF